MTTGALAAETLLDSPRPIRVVAAGKAAAGMAGAVRAVLGGRVIEGMVTIDRGSALPAGLAGDPRWTTVTASHPVPDAGSERAGRLALDLARRSAADDGLLLVCLSGGASSMLEVPAEGVSLDDVAEATRVLLRSGLAIDVLNAVRCSWSAIKGGGLGEAAGISLTLAISDVSVPAADEAATIGSGPTAGRRRQAAGLIETLAAAGVVDDMPDAIRMRLAAADALPAAGTAPGARRGGEVRIIASRREAMRAAADEAIALGYDPRVIEEPLLGSAADAWRRVWPAPGIDRPLCIIASGETTVRVTGDGRGGRNQELAVAALEPLAGLAPAGLASIGTDGIDGPTDAAGAIVDSGMWSRLGTEAVSRRDASLRNHDTYPLLDDLGALVRTGPSGTNVGDLVVLVLPAGPEARRTESD